MTLISSSVTGGSADGRNLRIPITSRVEPLMSMTAGAHNLDKKFMAPDIAAAMRSGL
jgi:hypothetical protein